MKSPQFEELLLELKARKASVEESIEALTGFIEQHPDSDEALLRRGMMHWQAGDRAGAINDYNAALRINPESPAKVALRQIYSILDFYDKDRYNP